MLLYEYFRSSAAYRVRIALNLKGLAYDHRSIHLRKGEQRAADYLGVNPQGLVPTLVIGNVRLTQSLAIMEYLEERHPLPPLLPEGAEDRAWVRAIALAIACDIHPINNTRVLQYLQRELQVDDGRRDNWYRHWIREGFEALEPMVRPGPYAFGSAVTLADICLVPQVFNAHRYQSLDLAPYPTIVRIYRTCLELPSFAAAHPDRQPDRES